MSNELLIGPLAPARRGVAGDRAYVGVAVATDVIGWCAALVVAVLLRYELALAEIDLSGLLWMSVVAAGVQVLVGVCRRSYTAGRAAAGDGGRLILSVFAVGLVVFVLTVLQAPPVPRSTPLIAIPIAALLLVGARAALHARIDRPDPTDPRRTRRAVVVGSGDDADYLVRSMLRDSSWGILPVATLGGDGTRRRIAGLGTARSGEGATALAERYGADLLVVATSDDTAVQAVSADADAAGLSVLVVPPLAELVRSLAPADLPDRSHDVPGHRGPGLRHRCRAAAKRALDVLLCVVALPLVLPVLLTVAVVLTVSGSEVFYRAQRVGLHGRRFTMFKFATMRPGDSGPRVTREGDPRITPVGRVLRSTKLNELPQVLNVLRGDMSIVGPRPEDPRYARSYTERHRAVWSVRPGMTSVAYLDFGDEQVFIERARPDDVEAYYLGELLPAKLDLELGYVRSWSARGDMTIIARTLGRLVRSPAPGRGPTDRALRRRASPAPPATSRSTAPAAASRRRR
ncbi:sugar transferase [Pseudonocardia sp. Ae168_Ps1]|uniref:sugar transferase n=1 Tax=Pseudonocardia sp. Ae168_Ps1 TaxID=1885029 RepID=UPI00094B1949|nr:sugar transferase [Pseudonocardia sp. Ae168_Ps1]